MQRFNVRAAFLLLLCLILLAPAAVPADEAAVQELTDACRFELSGKHPGAIGMLKNKYLDASVAFDAGEWVRLSWTDQVAPRAVCVQWVPMPEGITFVQFDSEGRELSSEPVPQYYDTALTVQDGAAAVELRAGGAGMEIGRLRVFGGGRLPEPFHAWEPLPERLDYLVIATHPDDDVLFMGAVIPIYGMERGYRGTVAYVTASSRKRISEAGSGAWTMGARYYPPFLGYDDIPMNYRDRYEKNFQLKDVTLGIVRLLRRCRPLVVFSHDTRGEYGHWQHRRVSASVSEAVRLCADPTYDPESAAQYGTWTVQKCYLHLYAETAAGHQFAARIVRRQDRAAGRARGVREASVAADRPPLGAERQGR